MNENISNEQPVLLKETIEQKGINLLFKGVKNIEVSDDRIGRSLKLFVSNVETDGSVSVADILFSAHDINGKCRIDERAGNEIYCYDAQSNNKKLVKNTAVGLYRLLAIHNGVSLDLDVVGGSISSAELKNYLIIPPNKAKRYIAVAEKEGITLKKAGTVLSVNSIIICRGNDILETVDKSTLTETAMDTMSLDSRRFDDYCGGYTALLSYDLCNSITDKSLLSFGLSGDVESVFARALGFFAASLSVRARFPKVKFLTDTKSQTVVPRPAVTDGEYFYLMKLRNDMLGLPDIFHFCQLKLYLKEFSKRGVIKNVLPYRENILGTLNRLSPETLEFDSIVSTPEQCFGVAVSVERGESVNGIKLGYFKSV